MAENTAAALIHYDSACRELAAASRIDEVKAIKDKAEALEAYGRLAKNIDLQLNAEAIKIRATHRLGELLEEMKQKGLRSKRGGDHSLKSNGSKQLSLQQLGIDNNLAHAARKAAKMSNEELEKELQRRRAKRHEKPLEHITAPKRRKIKPALDDFVKQIAKILDGFPSDTLAEKIEAIIENAKEVQPENLKTLVGSFRSAVTRLEQYANRLERRRLK